MSRACGDIEALEAALLDAATAGDVAALRRGLAALAARPRHVRDRVRAQLLYDACAAADALPAAAAAAATGVLAQPHRLDAIRALLRDGAALSFEGPSLSGGGTDLWNYTLHQVSCPDVLRVFVEERGKEMLDEMDDDAYRGGEGPQRATLLLRAAIEGDASFCEILLDLGADPNAGEDPYELYDDDAPFLPLHAAVVDGNAGLVRLLLRHGAAADAYAVRLTLEHLDGGRADEILGPLAPLVEDKRPLHQGLVDATAGHELDKVRRIVRLGIIDLNGELGGVVPGTTPLRCAMAHNNVDVAAILIENGTDPFKDDAGWWDSDFEASLVWGNLAFVELFLRHWTERFGPNGLKNEAGDAALHLVCQSRHASLEATRAVLNYQPEAVKMPDEELGFLPVFIAAMWDLDLDIVFALLSQYPEAIAGAVGMKHTSSSSVAKEAADGARNCSNIDDVIPPAIKGPAASLRPPEDDDSDDSCENKRPAGMVEKQLVQIAKVARPMSSCLRPPECDDDDSDNNEIEAGTRARKRPAGVKENHSAPMGVKFAKITRPMSSYLRPPIDDDDDSDDGNEDDSDNEYYVRKIPAGKEEQQSAQVGVNFGKRLRPVPSTEDDDKIDDDSD